MLVNLWAMSNFTWEWYLNFVQIFGVPLRIAKVDSNEPDAVKTLVDQQLAEAGSSGYMRLPTGVEIDIKEAAKSGDNTIHQSFLKYCDEICRKRVLGQTLTGGEVGEGLLVVGGVAHGVGVHAGEAEGGRSAVGLELQGRCEAEPPRPPRAVLDAREQAVARRVELRQPGLDPRVGATELSQIRGVPQPHRVCRPPQVRCARH